MNLKIFGLTLIVLALVLTPQVARAQPPGDDLNVVNAFGDVLKQEIGLVEDFSNYYKDAPVDTTAQVAVFVDELHDYKVKFGTYLTKYSSTAKTSHPSSALAINGTQDIINGLDQVIDGFNSGDTETAKNGEALLQSGVENLNKAVDSYNTYIEYLNQQVANTVSDTSGQSLGLEASSEFDAFFYYFNLPDLFIYFVLATVGYLFIYLWGKWLNKKSKKIISNFIENKTEKIFKGRKPLRSFGFLLILLLPYLFYLLAFALYASIIFSVLGFLLILYLPRVPLALPIGFGIVVLGTCFGVLIAVYRLFFPEKNKTLGIEIGHDKEENLWSITREIAEKIGSKPIDKIIIKPDSGIGVYLQGGLFQTIFGGGLRVLEIGVPSIYGLSISEFKAILAHEYGHFSNKDTQWSTFTYSMGSSLTNALKSIPGPSKFNEGEGWGSSLVKLIMALNPAYWSVLLFTKLFFKVTNGFSRMREVMADIRAMELFGGQTLADGLVKVSTNDVFFSEIIVGQYVPELLREEKTIANFSAFMNLIYKNTEKETLQKFQDQMINDAGKGTDYDSHPTLKIRLNYAARYNSKDASDDGKLELIFEDWEDLNKKLADLYNLRLIHLIQALNNKSKKNSDDSKKN